MIINPAVWTLTDPQGTIYDVANFYDSAILDRRDYDSYGILRSESSGGYSAASLTGFTPTLPGYTGYQRDSVTGLDYASARWYDPRNGRFINQDPSEFASGDANLYRYVANSPLTHTDPSGLYAQQNNPSGVWSGSLSVSEHTAFGFGSLSPSPSYSNQYNYDSSQYHLRLDGNIGYDLARQYISTPIPASNRSSPASYVLTSVDWYQQHQQNLQKTDPGYYAHVYGPQQSNQDFISTLRADRDWMASMDDRNRSISAYSSFAIGEAQISNNNAYEFNSHPYMGMTPDSYAEHQAHMYQRDVKNNPGYYLAVAGLGLAQEVGTLALMSTGYGEIAELTSAGRVAVGMASAALGSDQFASSLAGQSHTFLNQTLATGLHGVGVDLNGAQSIADWSEFGLNLTVGALSMKTSGAGRNSPGYQVEFDVSTPRNTTGPISLQLAPKSQGIFNLAARLESGPAAARGAVRATNFADHVWGKPDAIPCFTAETLVQTPEGPRQIAALSRGDRVLAYDQKNHRVVPRQVTALLKNWTTLLVKLTIGKEVVWATKTHPFYRPDVKEWVPACDLRAGMQLLDKDLQPRAIDDAQHMGTHEDTYNIEVEEFHTYFVGEAGLLVHNESIFASTFKMPTSIYAVYNKATNSVIYVGKTTQEIGVRFQQHISGKHPEWANGYGARSLKDGNWTAYESSVWEQHFIDSYGGKLNLHNVNNAISEAKYNQFKPLHNPC